MSRKWRKAKASRGAVPHVPYGPPVEKSVAPHHAGNDSLKAVGLTAAKIAAPFVLGAIFRALAKR